MKKNQDMTMRFSDQNYGRDISRNGLQICSFRWQFEWESMGESNDHSDNMVYIILVLLKI